jgi:hypothetical protein
MQLIYQLSGRGWAEARISAPGRHLDMVVSYLSGALGDMAQAALQLLRGEREAAFSFADEPGEHRWLLTRGDADSLHIRILWFREAFTGHLRRGPPGTEVFTCDCAVLDFVGQVSHVLQGILSDLGAEGYRREWGNADFPLGTFAQIQQLLIPQPR